MALSNCCKLLKLVLHAAQQHEFDEFTDECREQLGLPPESKAEVFRAQDLEALLPQAESIPNDGFDEVVTETIEEVQQALTVKLHEEDALLV